MIPQTKQSPLIIAHRGANKQAPENTRSAFDRALTYPVDGIEFDVQLSKDHIPIIFHDRTLTKVNGTRKRVSDFDVNELKKIDWGKWFGPNFENEPLLTLSELLNLYGTKTRLLVEIKSRPKDQAEGRSVILTKKTIELIEQIIPAEFWNRVYILSYDLNVLSQVIKLNEHLKCVLNLREECLANDIESSIGKGIYGMCLPIKSLNSSINEMIQANTYALFSYSCNIPSQLDKALQHHVDYILSDKPDWLLQQLKRSF